ncbi:MAG TPA: ACT domain-containing protein [Deltaproteobacteria bacterium]|nr:ACT domain-containing protein [Deltaproteobacteria bacterium]
MRTNIVFTLTGPDRAGVVKEITKLLLDLGGNVETSRMARLGGEFAVLMLVSMPQEKLADLGRSVQSLTGRGYTVTTSRTGQTHAESHVGWLPYQIEVYGADHEGIIHEIAHTLSQFGINIESMDTVTTRAPVSGAPLFSMSALVLVPPELPGKKWRSALEDVGNQVNVDIQVSAGPR